MLTPQFHYEKKNAVVKAAEGNNVESLHSEMAEVQFEVDL